MSSGSVTISYTTLAEVALVAALVGGIAYIGTSNKANQPHPTTSNLAPSHSDQGAQGAAKKSSKKKKKGIQPGAGAGASAVDAAAAAVEPVVEVATAVKDKAVAGATAAAKRAQQEAPAAVAEAQRVVQEQVHKLQEQAPAPSAGTKKGNKKKGGAAQAKNGGDKPDATKHAEEKAHTEQAATADMVDSASAASQPQVARVMKVVGGKVGADPAATGAAEDGWERADAFDDDDGGWEAVVSKSGSGRNDT